MNGILTIRDEATQQIINQPVFIPFLILNVNGDQSSANTNLQISSNSNLRINDIQSTFQQDLSNTKNKLLPSTKYVENDHDYCIINNLSCLTNHPLLGGAKKQSTFRSLKSTDAVTEDVTTPLTDSGTPLNNDNESNTDNEIIISDSDDPSQSPSNLKLPKSYKGNTRKKKKKPSLSKKVQKCNRCGKDIYGGFLNYHLGKHKRDDQKKIEAERKREEKKQASLTCGTCNEIFESKEELLHHFKVHPPFICDSCGRGFVKKDTFNAHKVTHNNPNSFICEVCGKGCKDAGSLRAHLQIHDNNKFKCTLCSKMFTTKGKLAYHVKRVHLEPQSFQCSYCGKLFTNRNGHNLHIKIIHMKEKPYECNICHKKFGRRDYLKNHKYTHTGEPRPKRKLMAASTYSRERLLKYISCTIKDNGEPVPCKFCGKAFQTVAGMKRHLLAHVKRYSCQFCSLTFCSKALSQRHEKIHEAGDFFRCDVCWKRFESQETLNKHAICHTNARYKCELCEKTFNRRYLMNHHRLMNHFDTSDKDKVRQIVTDSLLEVSENKT